MKTLSIGKENMGIVGFSYEVTNSDSTKTWITKRDLGRKTSWKVEVAHGSNWSEEYSTWFTHGYGHSHIYLDDKGPFYSIVGGYTDYTSHDSKVPPVKADEWGVETGEKFCLREGYAWNRFLNQEGYSRTYVYLIQKEGINNFLGSRIQSTSKDSSSPWEETNSCGEKSGKEINFAGSYGWSQKYGNGYNHFFLYVDEALSLDNKDAFWEKINEIEHEREEAKKYRERRIRELEEKISELTESLNKVKSEGIEKDEKIIELENIIKSLREQLDNLHKSMWGNSPYIEIPPKN